MITLNQFLENIIMSDIPFKIKVDYITYTFNLKQLTSLLYNFGDYLVEYYSIHNDEIMIYLCRGDINER